MNKLGRERVTVEELAAWLCWRLGGIVSGHEVLYEEGADEVTLSFRCAGGGGFVQERVCSRGCARGGGWSCRRGSRRRMRTGCFSGSKGGLRMPDGEAELPAPDPGSKAPEQVSEAVQKAFEEAAAKVDAAAAAPVIAVPSDEDKALVERVRKIVSGLPDQGGVATRWKAILALSEADRGAVLCAVDRFSDWMSVQQVMTGRMLWQLVKFCEMAGPELGIPGLPVPPPDAVLRVMPGNPVPMVWDKGPGERKPRIGLAPPGFDPRRMSPAGGPSRGPGRNGGGKRGFGPPR